MNTAASALEIPLIMSCLVLVGTLICTTLVDRFWRRRLLLVSISGIISSLGLLSFLFHIGINSAGGLKLPFSNIGVVDENRVFWYNIVEEKASGMGLLALAALAMYMISYSLGIGTVPWIINSELYPMKYRFVCVKIGNVAYWLTKLFGEGFFLDNLGRYFSAADMLFLLYSFSWVVGFFIYFYIPRTKGLQLEDVEKVLPQQEKQLQMYEYEIRNKDGQKFNEELKVLIV
ncbi:probable inositol transporter 2 [Papaver somniferum]|uniref:probable inositol transporter 2 n=1 Tax=Papaver somniferum TaxID=3469 RepID=UPI000E6FCAD6|nr:probable inositol transporter 2 [Papaver somniferum]